MNRDAKSQLNPAGRKAIRWLWHNEPMRPNILLQLTAAQVDLVFNRVAVRPVGGAKKLAALFKEAEGRIVHRNSVATVAQQLDHQKRLRHNGGARDLLQAEGYLLLSGKYHRDIAVQLGVPIPLVDEYISVRVVPTLDGSGVLLEGRYWRRALPEETVSEPAPYLTDR